MIYGSVCSGIEAASAAWHKLGWKPAFFSEIEDFPRRVLGHHYPDVPCHGDFTTIKENQYGPIDLLVGGTPCQAFSVAGLRKGFADERGNLTLEFIRLAQRLSPRWVVWENVPGVLSQDDGRAFGAFLGGLAELGYGFAYRILDAQYFGVPQRRRRVFVIGYFGDWRPAAAVLFEREGLRGDITPSREEGQNITPTIRSGSANGGRGHGARSGDSKDELIVPVTGTLSSREHGGGGLGTDFEVAGGVIPVAHTLRGEGFDASEDGTGRQNLVPEISPALKARDYKGPSSDGSGDGAPLIPVAIPIHDKATRHKGGGDTRDNDGSANGLGIGRAGDPCPTIDTGGRHGVAFGGQKMQVRRLTPRECERLQGFPDDFTLMKSNKPADGPRYKALGNSMAVPCMEWLGRRIELVDELQQLIKKN